MSMMILIGIAITLLAAVAATMVDSDEDGFAAALDAEVAAATEKTPSASDEPEDTEDTETTEPQQPTDDTTEETPSSKGTQDGDDDADPGSKGGWSPSELQAMQHAGLDPDEMAQSPHGRKIVKALDSIRRDRDKLAGKIEHLSSHQADGDDDTPSSKGTQDGDDDADPGSKGDGSDTVRFEADDVLDDERLAEKLNGLAARMEAMSETIDARIANSVARVVDQVSRTDMADPVAEIDPNDWPAVAGQKADPAKAQAVRDEFRRQRKAAEERGADPDDSEILELTMRALFPREYDDVQDRRRRRRGRRFGTPEPPSAFRGHRAEETDEQRAVRQLAEGLSGLRS